MKRLIPVLSGKRIVPSPGREAGCNESKASVIEYLKVENKVLREQLGDKQIKFTDAQRRRLAPKGKLVGRRGLLDLGCMVTPDTTLRYRQRAHIAWACSIPRADRRRFDEPARRNRRHRS